MNVTQVMPDAASAPDKLTATVMQGLMADRLARYQGFCEVEADRGFLKPTASLSSSHGQEMVRILIERTLEEVGESMEAEDSDHRKEEIIDAINFLMAAMLLDPSMFTPTSLATDVWMPALDWMNGEDSVLNRWGPGSIRNQQLGEITYGLTTKLGDYLRNRAWTVNAQDMYFNGQETFKQVVIDVLQILLFVFANETDFWMYFVAKDRILKFRLETAY